MVNALHSFKVKGLMSLVLAVVLMGHAWAVSKGDKAPEIQLKSLGSGDIIQLSEHRGKVVFVDFWASWCPPCLESLPLYNDMYNELKDYGLEVIAVNLDENPQDGLDFLNKKPVDYLVASDPKGTMAEAYGLMGMPTSYLVDQQGVVTMVHKGFKKKDLKEIKAKIIKALGR